MSPFVSPANPGTVSCHEGPCVKSCVIMTKKMTDGFIMTNQTLGEAWCHLRGLLWMIEPLWKVIIVNIQATSRQDRVRLLFDKSSVIFQWFIDLAWHVCVDLINLVLQAGSIKHSTGQHIGEWSLSRCQQSRWTLFSDTVSRSAN